MGAGVVYADSFLRTSVVTVEWSPGRSLSPYGTQVLHIWLGLLAAGRFFLAILLIISAYALFFFTAIAGRLWCGYACPQTVYTEIFMWIEQKIEGDRNKRMKLDKAPMSPASSVSRRQNTPRGCDFPLDRLHPCGLFQSAQGTARFDSDLGLWPWEIFWILFYGGFTYLFAGSCGSRFASTCVPMRASRA